MKGSDVAYSRTSLKTAGKSKGVGGREKGERNIEKDRKKEKDR